MQPSHSSRVSADWHSSTLPIKWAVQRRVLRKTSPDSHCVNAMGVKSREYVLELQAQGPPPPGRAIHPHVTIFTVVLALPAKERREGQGHQLLIE
jgi:hypothetical protein